MHDCAAVRLRYGNYGMLVLVASDISSESSEKEESCHLLVSFRWTVCSKCA